MDATIRSCVRLYCALCLLALILTGCGQEPNPISSQRAAFVGVWEQGRFGQGTTYEYLQISAPGYFSYARFEKSNGISTCVAFEKTPLNKITSTQITVSFLWIFTSDFEINRPPAEFGDTLRMTIDGNELTKTDSRQGGFYFSWSCNDGDLFRKLVI